MSASVRSYLDVRHNLFELAGTAALPLPLAWRGLDPPQSLRTRGDCGLVDVEVFYRAECRHNLFELTGTAAAALVRPRNKQVTGRLARAPCSASFLLLGSHENYVASPWRDGSTSALQGRAHHRSAREFKELANSKAEESDPQHRGCKVKMLFDYGGSSGNGIKLPSPGTHQ